MCVDDKTAKRQKLRGENSKSAPSHIHVVLVRSAWPEARYQELATQLSSAFNASAMVVLDAVRRELQSHESNVST